MEDFRNSNTEKVAKNRVSIKYKVPKKHLLLIALTVILAVSTAYIVYRLFGSNPNGVSSPFTSEIKQSVDFTLYYPANLPDGFKIEQDSVSQADEGVVIYAISNGSGKRITISVQQMPENINLDLLYNNLSDVYEIDTSYGKVKVGKDGNVLIGNVNANGTWLLFNTPNGNVTTEEFNQVLASVIQG